jgi:hypothetical protein
MRLVDIRPVDDLAQLTYEVVRQARTGARGGFREARLRARRHLHIQWPTYGARDSVYQYRKTGYERQL